MRKSDYDSIFNEIYKKDKKIREDIISYKEIKKMLCFLIIFMIEKILKRIYKN